MPEHRLERVPHHLPTATATSAAGKPGERLRYIRPVVDLCVLLGGNGGVLCVLMSELGTATHIREKFRSAEAFASWLGLCPDNRISGGRILKAGTRKVTNRIANILRMAANALSREQGRMGEYVRRFKGRLGKAEGIVAGAHT